MTSARSRAWAAAEDLARSRLAARVTSGTAKCGRCGLRIAPSASWSPLSRVSITSPAALEPASWRPAHDACLPWKAAAPPVVRRRIARVKRPTL